MTEVLKNAGMCPSRVFDFYLSEVGRSSWFSRRFLLVPFALF